MEGNKPIFSKKISAGTRVYYFDARQDSKGQCYLTISEIPTDKAPANKKRQRLFIHAEYLGDFVDAFASLSDAIEKLSNQQT